MKILVLYHTKTGHTLEAINPFVESVTSKGSEVDTVLAKDFNPSMIEDYDAFLVGTPCWAGSSGVVGVATPVVNAIKKLGNESLQGKICGGIAIHAKYGGETTLSHLERLLNKKGGKNFMPGPVVKAGTLMSVFKGPSVSKSDEDRIRIYANDFVS